MSTRASAVFCRKDLGSLTENFLDALSSFDDQIEKELREKDEEIDLLKEQIEALKTELAEAKAEEAA